MQQIIQIVGEFMQRVWKNIKKIVLCFLAVALLGLYSPIHVTARAADDCGKGLTWSLVGSTLTISGQGTMYDFEDGAFAPWYSDRYAIVNVLLEEGVENVGALAFYDCTRLSSVKMSPSVEKVGAYSFAGCVGLKSVLFGNVISIGNSAFSRCEKLSSLSLPATLSSIGKKAFFECRSLLSVTIPENVVFLGSQVFGYCTELVSAYIEANVDSIPTWCFYGCEKLVQISLAPTVKKVGQEAFTDCASLSSVYYEGDKTDANVVQHSITSQVKDVTFLQEQAPSGVPVVAESMRQEENTIYFDNISLQQTDNSIISVTSSTSFTIENEEVVKAEDAVIHIQSVVINENGWEEVKENVIRQKDLVDESKNGSLKVEVVANDESTSLQKDFMQDLKGSNVTVTLETLSGSTTSVDFNRIQNENLSEMKDSYDFTYSVFENNSPKKSETKVIGDAKSYNLNFSDSIDFDHSPSIYIDENLTGRIATLYQNVPGKGLELLQSVVIDKAGYASYYLQSTIDTTDYLIALDVEGVSFEDAIIPESMSSDFGNIENAMEIEYVVTGVRLFMGMSLFQFFIVVFAVVTVMVIAIGAVMFVLYRQKRLELVAQLQHGKANVEEIHKYLNEE